MKQQQQQARELYFQSELNKTQIAQALNIPRRTLHYWIKENNWERQKQSAAHMPVLLAENCYHILARFSQQLLGEDRIMRPVTHQEADTLYKLTLTANKLKNRYSLNESMELFGTFMDRVHRVAPELATQISPFVDDYIGAQSAKKLHDYSPDYFNEHGLITRQEENVTEQQLDMQDIMAWTEDRAGKDNEEQTVRPESEQALQPAIEKEHALSCAAQPVAAQTRSALEEKMPALVKVAGGELKERSEITKEDIQKMQGELKGWDREMRLSAPHTIEEFRAMNVTFLYEAKPGDVDYIDPDMTTGAQQVDAA